eukprot:TRINITY_DN4780_c0_g2_i1.p1 TRINITY_DN4780_c0_g2~~TRINITY_DN4780_c0_g2_i1.p1  ORF type:complete len:634 (-),score=123.61 TRINITY_DN4780_c0_g2_i1:194-2095(-)
MALKKPPAPPGALRGDPPNQVLPYLYIGSAANAANRTELISLGITHILNVKESYFASTPSGFEFLHVAMSDYGNQNIKEVLPPCFEFIQSAKNKDGKILVHCRGGVNRSATVVLAWMMHGEKMILKDAWHLLRSKRSVVSPHEQYIAQLKDYEQELFGSVTLTPEDTGLSAQARMRQFMLLGKKGIVDAANAASQQDKSTAPDLTKRPSASGPAPRLGRGSISGLGSGSSSSILVRESNSQPTAPEIEGMSQASLAIEVASKDAPPATDSRDRSESSTTASRSESPGMTRKSRSGDAKKHKKHRNHGRTGSNVSNSANSLTSENDSTTSSLRQSEKSHTEASDSSHSARTGSSSTKKKKKKSSTTNSLSTSDSSTSIRSRSPSVQTDSDAPKQSSKRKLTAVNEDQETHNTPAATGNESKSPKTQKRTSRSSATPTEPKQAGSASESDHTVAAPEKRKRSKSKTTAEPETEPEPVQATACAPSDAHSAKSTGQSPRTLKNLFSGIFGRTKGSKKESKVAVSPSSAEDQPSQDDKSSSSEEKHGSEKKSHRKKGDRRGHSKSRMVHSSSFSISASTSTSTSSGKHSMDVVNSNKHDAAHTATTNKHIPANIKILSQERTSTSARSSSSTSSSGT